MENIKTGKNDHFKKTGGSCVLPPAFIYVFICMYVCIYAYYIYRGYPYQIYVTSDQFLFHKPWRVTYKTFWDDMKWDRA